MQETPQPYLVFDTTGVIDDAHTGGVGSHVQPFDDLRQEDFDLLKFRRTDAPAAVDDEDDVRGTGFTQSCSCTKKDVRQPRPEPKPV